MLEASTFAQPIMGPQSNKANQYKGRGRDTNFKKPTKENQMRWLLYAGIGIAALIALITVVGLLLPKAHVATRSATFKQPPAVVFATLAGPPDWRPDVTKFEILSTNGGNPKWKEYDHRGRAILYERTESNPPHRMVTRIADPTLPFGGTWIYEIREAGGGTELQITEHGEVYNPIFRFVSRFIMGHTATIDKYLEALTTKLK